MNKYTVQEFLTCSPPSYTYGDGIICRPAVYLAKWEDIESFNALEDAVEYVRNLCWNKGCELVYFRIYDNTENKVVVDWSKKDIMYADVDNSASLIADVYDKKSINDDDIFSKMSCACEGMCSIIDMLESDYNKLTNIDVYIKYRIKTSISMLYSDMIELKSLLEDCKECV